MRILYFFSGFIISFSALYGQPPVGAWTDHLDYGSAVQLAVSPSKIYASTGEALIIYNKEFSELTKLSTVNGLTETGISCIAWSDDSDLLIVAYKSANIDLLSGNTIYNIPEIMFGTAGEISIQRIRTSGRYAYLATDYGIIVIDLIRREIRDTWKPGSDSGGNRVYDVATGNGLIYAATENGVWYGELANTGLSYFGNWKQVTGLPELRSNLLIYSGGRLYANYPMQFPEGDQVYSAGSDVYLFSSSAGIQNRSFDVAPGGFSIASGEMARVYNTAGALINSIRSYGWGNPDICQAIIDAGDAWIADKTHGLVHGAGMTDFRKFTLPGPASDKVVNITTLNGTTLICAGGTDGSWEGLGRDFQVSIHANGSFSNIISGNAKDAMRCCFDPSDHSHFFVSSWGHGLFEYRNNLMINHYHSGNSPLGDGAGTDPAAMLCGMTFDRDGNLWMVQGHSASGVKVLTADGKWIIFPCQINTRVPGDIIAAPDGNKWIIQPKLNSLFIIDDNNTPGLLSDDRYLQLPVRDTEGNYFSVFSLNKDLEGNIWAGTDKGPLVYFNTENIFEKSPAAYRIKISRDDGSGLADYLLGTETITSIAVDGANRKWLGTSGSGAYLLSPDGGKVLKTFNKSNSPLFSDSIATIAVDNRTGEVWFGTAGGILSVRETATSGGQEFTGVYSFPNPVREDFSGNVTITGLMKDTNVKITDVSGNLVFETTSTGGQASWDLKTFNGKRVVTGVYLVFCSSADGSQSCTTRILVISR
ncbi:MAG TPA: T9SS type A sorting domain-containing protein [Bacteroidales bacterium]|jgi:streptogramin lyase|nr:T9SS type A sorting domain-containing protein [Bacteroidales bacterium]